MKGEINIKVYNNSYANNDLDINTNETFTEKKYLEYGDSSDEVKILQQKLKILGYYNDSVTSSYGESTVIAVENFERNNGYTVDGKVDREMYKKIIELTMPNIPEAFSNDTKATLKKGDRGSEVLELQEKLKDILYYFGENTGYFGDITENAVKAFQVNNRLTSDGIVGKNTWSILDFLYKPQKDCKENETENKPKPETENETIYIVKPGDTLYKIAMENNISVDKLKTLNNLSSNMIVIGQKLIISEEEGKTEYEHIVRPGETLYSIALKYNTTVSRLVEMNNLDTNILTIGQILKVPSRMIYTVKSGDSLYSIAQKFNTTVSRLKDLNGLTSNIIRVGAQLLVN